MSLAVGPSSPGRHRRRPAPRRADVLPCANISASTGLAGSRRLTAAQTRFCLHTVLTFGVEAG